MATHCKTPNGDVVLILSPGEVRGLAVIANEGYEGLFDDPPSIRARIGTPSAWAATQRAYDALRAASGSTRKK